MSYLVFNEGLVSKIKKIGKAVGKTALVGAGAYGLYKASQKLRRPGEVPANEIHPSRRIGISRPQLGMSRPQLGTKKYLPESADVSQQKFNLSPSVIPDYGKDHSYRDDGESRETMKMNIPSLLAARTAGGYPFSNTLHNDPSSNMAPDVFKLSK